MADYNYKKAQRIFSQRYTGFEAAFNFRDQFLSLFEWPRKATMHNREEKNSSVKRKTKSRFSHHILYQKAPNGSRTSMASFDTLKLLEIKGIPITIHNLLLKKTILLFLLPHFCSYLHMCNTHKSEAVAESCP